MELLPKHSTEKLKNDIKMYHLLAYANQYMHSIWNILITQQFNQKQPVVMLLIFI